MTLSKRESKTRNSAALATSSAPSAVLMPQRGAGRFLLALPPAPLKSGQQKKGTHGS